ncbi:hypothetical protein [Geodermatophilus sp. SYSU D00710]
MVRELTALIANDMGVPQSSAEHIVRTSILATHKIFDHYLLLLDLARKQWDADYIEYAFAASGGAAERGFLDTFLQPAVTLLEGGRWLNSASLELTFLEIAAGPAMRNLHLNKMADIATSMFETQRRLKRVQFLDRKVRAMAGEDARDMPAPDPPLWTGQPSPEQAMISGFEFRDSASPVPDARPAEWDAFVPLAIATRERVEAAVTWLLAHVDVGEVRIIGRPSPALQRARPSAATRWAQLLAAEEGGVSGLPKLALDPRYFQHREILLGVASYADSIEFYAAADRAPLARLVVVSAESSVEGVMRIMDPLVTRALLVELRSGRLDRGTEDPPMAPSDR